MSDKPGETCRITLYQLSSIIMVPNDNKSGEFMSKMSLLLAYPQKVPSGTATNSNCS